MPTTATTETIEVEKVVEVLANVLAGCRQSDDKANVIDDVLRGLFGEFQPHKSGTGFIGIHGRVYEKVFGPEDVSPTDN
jgi:hypothetical protein